MSIWWNQLQQQLQLTLQELRVGVYGGGGAPYHHAALIALWGGKPVIIGGQGIKDGALESIDVLVVPGGGMRAMEGLLQPMGVDGAARLRRWVAGGGMYIGSCAGSFLPACIGDGYWSAHLEARELYMMPACLANSGESELEGLISPGVGAVRVALERPDHWLADGLPEHFELVHYNGPMFTLHATQDALHEEALVPATGVVRFTGAATEFTPSEGFFETARATETLFESCVQRHAYTAIVTRYGSGTVVLFGSHPEFGFDSIQLGWNHGVQLLANALKHQATNMTGVKPTSVAEGATSPTVSLRSQLRETAEKLSSISQRYVALSRTAPSQWLVPGKTPSFMGRSPQELWSEGLRRAAEVSAATAAYMNLLVDARNENELAAAASWIDHQAQADQDFGFVGLRQLVDRIEEAISLGETKLGSEPFAMQHAYDGFLDHPFHLLVGSYLSAAGLTASAALSSAVIGSLVDYLDGVPVGPQVEQVADSSPNTTPTAF